MSQEIEMIQKTANAGRASKLSSITKATSQHGVRAAAEGLNEAQNIQSSHTVELERVNSEITGALQMMNEIRSQLESQQKILEQDFN
jgi:hypothetical protein